MSTPAESDTLSRYNVHVRPRLEVQSHRLAVLAYDACVVVCERVAHTFEQLHRRLAIDMLAEVQHRYRINIRDPLQAGLAWYGPRRERIENFKILGQQCRHCGAPGLSLLPLVAQNRNVFQKTIEGRRNKVRHVRVRLTLDENATVR